MQVIYTKDNQQVVVYPKFIYCITVYRIWKRGACLLDEKNYVSAKPLNLKDIPSKCKKKGYTIQRFIELKGAPEDYLITKGYKNVQKRQAIKVKK